jgi:ribosome-binding ATPase YchF (GTP1/OBG family)
MQIWTRTGTGYTAGAGLGNQFLANIRECDAIIEVVRCFEDPEITHVDGSIDVIRDIDVIDMELALADLAMLEKATTKSKSKSRTAEENAVLERALDGLSNGQWASSLGFNKTELETLRLYPLLTLKVSGVHSTVQRSTRVHSL